MKNWMNKNNFIKIIGGSLISICFFMLSIIITKIIFPELENKYYIICIISSFIGGISVIVSFYYNIREYLEYSNKNIYKIDIKKISDFINSISEKELYNHIETINRILEKIYNTSITQDINDYLVNTDILLQSINGEWFINAILSNYDKKSHEKLNKVISEYYSNEKKGDRKK